MLVVCVIEYHSYIKSAQNISNDTRLTGMCG